MQVSETITTSNTYTVTLVLTNSQVAMLDKRGATLVDQVRNSYPMNALMLSGCTSLDRVISKTTSNGETNTTYLLQPYLSPSYAKEEIPSRKLLASPMSSGERTKTNDTDDTSK